MEQKVVAGGVGLRILGRMFAVQAVMKDIVKMHDRR